MMLLLSPLFLSSLKIGESWIDYTHLLKKPLIPLKLGTMLVHSPLHYITHNGILKRNTVVYGEVCWLVIFLQIVEH